MQDILYKRKDFSKKRAKDKAEETKGHGNVDYGGKDGREEQSRKIAAAIHKQGGRAGTCDDDSGILQGELGQESCQQQH